MEAVARCEALLWQALEASAADWRTLQQLACRAQIAPQTGYRILGGLVSRGLVARVRLGLPAYYRLAGDSAERKAHARAVAQTVEILKLAPQPCGKRASA
jgi:DNA-binding IclR family transcriptional regulator